MKYNLSKAEDVAQAWGYLDALVEGKKIVSITKVSPSRSLRQNNYLHLLLGAFGLHFGYTIEESKLIYKEINKVTYYYKKKGRQFIRSSADLSQEEMAKTIDNFMQKSAEAGYELPLATDQEWLMQIENEIERSQYFTKR